MAPFPEQPPQSAQDSEATLPHVSPQGDDWATLSPAASRELLAASFQVPGYAIEAELGRGGMGVVYQARQVRLDRVVALKMIVSGAQAGPEELARFRTEAEAIAHLQHPNIVQVYEVGEYDGKPFFSLEFCAGGSLASRLDGTPFPAKLAAALVATLARAMHAAHQAGIVHRDLKPGNILLTGGRPLPANPSSSSQAPDPLVPKIADFGLAKKLSDEQGRTRTGTVLGTPSYMAPEQAGGQAKQVGPSADIYALGAILYELLTGRPPFKAETPLDTILQVLECQPVPPRLLNPRVPRDLETICLKCLEKNPQHRYSSGAALAEDLERFARGEPISARSYNMFDLVAQAVGHAGSHQAEFYSWSRLLLVLAGLTLAFTLLKLWLQVGRPLHRDIWNLVAQTGLLAGVAAVFWRQHKGRLVPVSPAEREMWTIWLSFLCACILNRVVSTLLATPEHPLDEVALFPRFAILSGMAFLIMGNHFTGLCYLYGLGFFLLAAIMALYPAWAIVEFGTMWVLVLAASSLYLGRLSREASESSAPR